MSNCECDLRNRKWNPYTRQCETCGCHYIPDRQQAPHPEAAQQASHVDRRDLALRASGALRAIAPTLRYIQEDLVAISAFNADVHEAAKLVIEATTNLAIAQAQLNKFINFKPEPDRSTFIPTEGSCQLILERNSGPGRGTACPHPAVELLHGSRVCFEHANYVRKANGMPSLPEIHRK